MPHVLMMVIPEAWEDNRMMDMKRKAFYKYHASIIEPWDGPASFCFTDGKMIGATLDRNGLRPSRYCITSDGRVIMSSEAGALPADQAKVISKGRLQPGKMFVVDLEKRLERNDEEIKDEVCSQQHYGLRVNTNGLKLILLSK